MKARVFPLRNPMRDGKPVLRRPSPVVLLALYLALAASLACGVGRSVPFLDVDEELDRTHWPPFTKPLAARTGRIIVDG